MDGIERASNVHGILQNLSGVESLKSLFYEKLGYDRVSRRLSRRNWTDTAHNALREDPLLLASGGSDGDFHIIYSQLDGDRLLLGKQRAVISRLLEDHPYALFVFSNSDQDQWHFVNVKPADDPKKRRLFRRITVGPHERLRTASERLAMLDLESISPDLLGLSPLAIQNRHDEAFDVEAVTDKFFRAYKAIFKLLQGDLHEEAGNRQ